MVCIVVQDAPQDLFPRLRICDTGIWRVTNWFIIIIIIIML